MNEVIENDKFSKRQKSHWEKYKIYYLLTLGNFFLILLIILISNFSIRNDIKRINNRLDFDETEDPPDQSPHPRKPFSFDNDFYIPKEEEKEKNWIESQIFQEDLQKKLKRKIKYFNNIRPYLTKKATHVNKNILFYGPPGTGKSYYAELLAKNESSTYLKVAAGELQQFFVGSGAWKWRGIFDKAKKKAARLPKNAKPVMIIVDEFDSLGGSGKDNPIHKKDDTLVNTFLTCMDEIHDQKLNIAVLATTNYLSMLESAAIRPGRFDNLIEIKYSSSQEEYNKLCDYLKKSVEEKIKNKKNRKLWMDEIENKIIEFSPSFWVNVKKKVWEIVSLDNDLLQFSGFSLLTLETAVKECISDKIDDNSQNIYIDNSSLAIFTEKLGEEKKVKEQEIKNRKMRERLFNPPTP